MTNFAGRLNKDECLKLFQKFDNGNKILSVAEFDRALRWWHPEFGTDPQALRRAFKEADKNGSGFIEFPEFCECLQLIVYYNQLMLLFKKLDKNNDKRLSFDEFKKGHDLIGTHTKNQKQLKEEFDRIDKNKGGFILFDEFCMHMAKQKLLQ